MPSSVLSHQGIVLPLKIKYPKKFDGTALCVGSFAPDLAFLVSYFQRNHATPHSIFHSVGGLIYIIPFSILLVILFDKALLPAASTLDRSTRYGLLSKWLAFFGVDECQVLKRKKITLEWFVKATYSVLLGVLSHFLLDLLTHGQILYLSPFYAGAMPEWFLHEHVKLNIPFYDTINIANWHRLWFFFSVAFASLALHNMRYIRKNQLLLKWYNIQQPCLGLPEMKINGDQRKVCGL